MTARVTPRSDRAAPTSCRWTFTAPLWRCGAGRRHAVAPYVPRFFPSSLTAAFDYTSHTLSYATSVFRCNFSNNVTSQAGIRMSLFFPPRRLYDHDIMRNRGSSRSVGPGGKEFLMLQCIKCNVSFHFHLEGVGHICKTVPRGYPSFSNSILLKRAASSFPLLTVMRSCNSLSVSLARSPSLSSPQRSELRQLAYKIADSNIQLHNQDKGDGGQEEEDGEANVKDGLGNSAEVPERSELLQLKKKKGRKVGRCEVIEADWKSCSEAELLRQMAGTINTAAKV